MEVEKGAPSRTARGSRCSSVRGFTLLEMLLAITIFSMVVVIIFSAFRLGSSSWEKGEQDLEQFQRIRAVTELLYREIRSCFPYAVTPGELDTHVKFYAFFGGTDSLKFVTTASLHNMNRSLSFLEFWVKDGKGLMAGEARALGSDLSDSSLRDKERALCIDPAVKKIRFRYYDQKKKDEQGEWVQNWNPRDKVDMNLRLPRAVEVDLSFDLGRGRTFDEVLVIPIFVDTLTALLK